MKKSYEIDMTRGVIFPKILSFSLPLMFTGMLQLLFNAADVVVVGRFVGPKAMAAVGSSARRIERKGAAGSPTMRPTRSHD